MTADEDVPTPPSLPSSSACDNAQQEQHQRPVIPTLAVTSPSNYGRINPENESNLALLTSVSDDGLRNPAWQRNMLVGQSPRWSSPSSSAGSLHGTQLPEIHLGASRLIERGIPQNLVRLVPPIPNSSSISQPSFSTAFSRTSPLMSYSACHLRTVPSGSMLSPMFIGDVSFRKMSLLSPLQALHRALAIMSYTPRTIGCGSYRNTSFGFAIKTSRVN